jgi:leucyl-tRNA synthetase
MPGWAGSSWYFLRYADPHNENELVSKEKAKQWLPVDMYVGGIEHAVLHLLYARFYTKFLYDIGAVDFEEPFKRLFNQGMITKDSVKMSKSKGNVVSPDELVERYGCDSLRMYELFVGPPELDSEWDDRGIDGVYRFINKVWKLVVDSKDKNIAPTKEMERMRHKLVYEITTRMENIHLNTVVSGFMEYTNKLTDIAKKEGAIDQETIDTLIVLLAPFTPHLAEELWQMNGHKETVFNQSWPTYDENKMKEDSIEIAIQINGKVKAAIEIAVDEAKDAVLEKARKAIEDKLEGKNIVKEIYVPGKIINIVAK